MNSIKISAGFTDYYQVTMGQAYFLTGNRETRAGFDYFFRKLPFEGGYVIFAGLQNIMEILGEFSFTSNEIDYFHKEGLHEEYLEYLKDFSFRGNIYSVREGDVVFPTEPVLRVEANIIEAQMIETLLLNYLNFHSLIATKASRIKKVAGERVLTDFGLRRAQGLGAYHASYAAMIGGFNSTSNVKTGVDFNLPVSGTMAHSFVQNQDDELTAFRKYAEAHPDECILLVDTYNTLKSGVPNAIRVAKELKEKGRELKAIRLDSGDLAYQAKKSREMLDKEGLKDVKIVASNQLDEYVIKSLLDQGAPIDFFGVGTSLITADPDGALDGVYKLSESDGKPRMKLSENLSKMTLPGKKDLYRLLDDKGNFYGGDLICREGEDAEKMYHPLDKSKNMNLSSYKKENLHEMVMEKGKIRIEKRNVNELAEFSAMRMKKLPDEFKRFDNPHVYKIGISPELMSLRDKLRENFKSRL
jgi:nicotinate phosphoribosyltransferase